MAQAASTAASTTSRQSGSNADSIHESRPLETEDGTPESVIAMNTNPVDVMPTNSNTKVPAAPSSEAEKEAVQKGELSESTVDKASATLESATPMITYPVDLISTNNSEGVPAASTAEADTKTVEKGEVSARMLDKTSGTAPKKETQRVDPQTAVAKSPPANEQVTVPIYIHGRINSSSIESLFPQSKQGKWATQWESLRQFYEKHGHSRVPRSQGPLGTWCHHQRKQFKLFRQGKHSQITSERIEKLNELNFEFDPFVSKWHQAYELLMKFKQEHGHCRLPTNYTVNDVNLWNWVMCQRRAYKQSQAAGKLGRINQDRIDMLRAAGVVFEENPRKITDNEKFFSKLAMLKEFKEKYGRNCPIPSEFVLPENGIKLGRWATVQRWRYRMHVKKGKKSSLTQDRIDALNAIGFIWNPPRKILVGLDFGGKGDKDDKDDPEEQDDVSMCSDDEAAGSPSQQQEAYQKQTEPSSSAPCAKPPPTTTEVAVSVQGVSAAHQKCASGAAEANHSQPTVIAGVNKPQAVNLPVSNDVTRTTASGTSFNQDAMRKVHLEFSSGPKKRPSLPMNWHRTCSMKDAISSAKGSNQDERSPGQPQDTAKECTRTGAISMASTEQPSIMDEDGNEEEDASSADLSNSADDLQPNAKRGRKNESQWNYNFSLLEAFKDQYGHCVVPRTYTVAGSTLGYWVHSQRAEYQASRNGRARSSITRDRIARLQSIGFDWDPIETQWRTNFNRLLQFREQFGHFRVPHHFKYDDGDTFNLYAWVGKQRAEWKKFMDGKKSHTNQSRIDRLQAVNFDFEETPRLKVDTDRWYANLELLKQYHREFGHWHVPKPYKTDGIPLGVWVAKQKYRSKTLRNNGKGFLMSKDRLDKLKELGVDWAPLAERAAAAARLESDASTSANDSTTESGAPSANVGNPVDRQFSHSQGPTGVGFNGFGNAFMLAPPTVNDPTSRDRMPSVNVAAPDDRRFSLPLGPTGTDFNEFGNTASSLAPPTAPSFRNFAMAMSSSERHRISDALSNWHSTSHESERNGPIMTHGNAGIQDDRILSNMEIDCMIAEATQRVDPWIWGAHAARMMNLPRDLAFEQPHQAGNASYPMFAAAAASAAAESARNFGMHNAASSYQSRMAPVPKSAVGETTGNSKMSTATGFWQRQATTLPVDTARTAELANAANSRQHQTATLPNIPNSTATAAETVRKAEQSTAANSCRRQATTLPNSNAAETARKAEQSNTASSWQSRATTLLKKAAEEIGQAEEASTSSNSWQSRATTLLKQAAEEIGQVEEVSTSTNTWQSRATTVLKQAAEEIGQVEEVATSTSSRQSRAMTLPKKAAAQIATQVEKVSTSTSSWHDRTKTLPQSNKSGACQKSEEAKIKMGALTESSVGPWTSPPRRPKRKKTAFKQVERSKKRKSNKEEPKTRERRTMACDEKDESFVSAEDMLDHFEF